MVYTLELLKGRKTQYGAGLFSDTLPDCLTVAGREWVLRGLRGCFSPLPWASEQSTEQTVVEAFLKHRLWA